MNTNIIGFVFIAAMLAFNILYWLYGDANHESNHLDIDQDVNQNQNP